MGSRKLIGLLSVLVATAAEGETTRLDSEYFAFTPTRVLAVKSQGVWRRAPVLFQLGVKGNRFVFDAREDKGGLPPLCRGILTTSLPASPKFVPLPFSIFDGQDAQYLDLMNDNCGVRIWMTGQHDGTTELPGIIPGNNTKSLSYGLIEFRSVGKTTAIEFAVLVEDAPAVKGKR